MDWSYAVLLIATVTDTGDVSAKVAREVVSEVIQRVRCIVARS